jgi:hypothetical protein
MRVATSLGEEFVRTAKGAVRAGDQHVARQLLQRQISNVFRGVRLTADGTFIDETFLIGSITTVVRNKE